MPPVTLPPQRLHPKRPLPGKRPGQESKPSRWRKVGLLALAALALFGIGAGAYFLFEEDPVEHVKDLRAELNPEKMKDLPPEERRAKFREFFEERNKLSPKQQAELDAERREKQREKMNTFFKKSRAEQTKELDKIPGLAPALFWGVL